MDNTTEKFVDAILALVDETPSEPFSYERKRLRETLIDMTTRFSEQIDDETQEAFELGYDTGANEKLSDVKEVLKYLKDELMTLARSIDDIY